MLIKRLDAAFKMTSEDDSSMFERYANAFLIPNFPELEGVGGKKDKGMDARVIRSDSDQLEIVVQSCVSPRTKARSKIMDTIKKLEGDLPHTLIYCTPATIGLSLDETKKELRQKYRIVLEIFDATWFIQRALTTDDRIKLCEAYATHVLEPLMKSVEPKRLYSEALSEDEERLVTQYLEAHSLDRARGRNLTKALYDALITFVIRDSDPETNLYPVEVILESICSMFPTGHHARIREIVPGRIKHLVSKDVIKYHQKDNRYVLSYPNRKILKKQLSLLEQREIVFRASLKNSIVQSIEMNEIDYDCDEEALMLLGHNCILWYMWEQGKQLQNPMENLLNFFNAEELIFQYLSRQNIVLNNPQANYDIVMDILPTALFEIIRSKDHDVRNYLRSKSDVFIAQAFLQVTPDVQKACKKLFSRDVIYVGTTILIHCTAELYSEESPQQLIPTLETARALGIRLKTFRPFIREFVAHLQGPVRLEWLNHFKTATLSNLTARLSAAPKLLGVFNRYATLHGRSVEQIIDDIIGYTDSEQNAIEFLEEEFGIVTEDIPNITSGSDQTEWKTIFGQWLEAKRRLPRMKEERFELLVRNDVNAYTAIRQMRRETKLEGEDYGHKIWLLTLDRMYWKMPNLLNKRKDFSYHVAMSLDYLVSFVATLANIDARTSEEFTLPAIVVVDEDNFIPAELRETVTAELEKENTRKYMKRRRIRELVHKTKTESGDVYNFEDVVYHFEADDSGAASDMRDSSEIKP